MVMIMSVMKLVNHQFPIVILLNIPLLKIQGHSIKGKLMKPHVNMIT